MYTVVTLAFLPLFSVIMCKIRKDYSKLYKSVACKMISLFTVLMIFLILRLLIYIDINFSNLVFQGMDSIGLKSEIPFFISEIIITIALSYILFAVGKSTKDSETLNKKRKSPRLSQ
jgi:biotin transporter BioY